MKSIIYQKWALISNSVDMVLLMYYHPTIRLQAKRKGTNVFCFLFFYLIACHDFSKHTDKTTNPTLASPKFWTSRCASAYSFLSNFIDRQDREEGREMICLSRHHQDICPCKWQQWSTQQFKWDLPKYNLHLIKRYYFFFKKKKAYPMQQHIHNTAWLKRGYEMRMAAV